MNLRVVCCTVTLHNTRVLLPTVGDLRKINSHFIHGHPCKMNNPRPTVCVMYFARQNRPYKFLIPKKDWHFIIDKLTVMHACCMPDTSPNNWRHISPISRASLPFWLAISMLGCLMLRPPMARSFGHFERTISTRDGPLSQKWIVLSMSVVRSLTMER